MFGLGVQELLIILVIVLVFFGAEKIPQLAKSLGKGMAEFRKAQQDLKAEIDNGSVDSVPAPNDPGVGLAASTAGDNPPAVSYITCPSCHQSTAEGSLFCSQCGKRLSGMDRCLLCQRQLRADEKFCPNCGSPRENAGQVTV